MFTSNKNKAATTVDGVMDLSSAVPSSGRAQDNAINHAAATKEKKMELNHELAAKVLAVVDAGLVSGIGLPMPGKMCVEAAVCYAMGLPHSDQPTCVGGSVRQFKITLNDSSWPTDADRTAGMRKLAIAQLGSDTIDQLEFARLIGFGCNTEVLPVALRHAASLNGKFAAELTAAAVACESAPDFDSAKVATLAALDITNKAKAYTRSHFYAYTYDNAYAYACAYACANTHAYAAAYADADAKTFAYTYTYAYDIADDALRLKMLKAVAQVGLDALIALKSPGCEFLYLCDDELPE